MVLRISSPFPPSSGTRLVFAVPAHILRDVKGDFPVRIIRFLLVSTPKLASTQMRSHGFLELCPEGLRKDVSRLVEAVQRQKRRFDMNSAQHHKRLTTRL